jgi:hypothetical protein
MTCREAQEWLWLDLAGEETGAGAHVLQCPGCSAERERIRPAFERLHLDLDLILRREPEWQSRTLRALAREGAPSIRSRLYLRVYAAAAAVLLASGAIVALLLQAEAPEPERTVTISLPDSGWLRTTASGRYERISPLEFDVHDGEFRIATRSREPLTLRTPEALFQTDTPDADRGVEFEVRVDSRKYSTEMRVIHGRVRVEQENEVPIEDPEGGTMNARMTRVMYAASMAGLFVFAASVDAAAQTLTWSRTSSGYEATGVDVDSNGNVYAGGINNGITVRKYNSAGVLQWSKESPSTYVRVNANSLAVDGQGNAIAVGYGGGTGFEQKGVVVKYNKDGQLLWSKQLLPGGYEFGFSGVAVDGDGNIYLGGNSRWSNSGGVSTGYTYKLDSAGNTVWNSNLGGGVFDSAMNYCLVAVGTTGIWSFSTAGMIRQDPATGEVQQAISDPNDPFFQDFHKTQGIRRWGRGAYDGTHFLATGWVNKSKGGAAPNYDILTTKSVYDTGEAVWSVTFGAKSTDFGHAVAEDANSVYVAGRYHDGKKNNWVLLKYMK